MRRRGTLRDWVLTIPALLIVSLSLLIADPLLRLVRRRSEARYVRARDLTCRIMLGAFRVTGTKIEVEWSPGVDRNGRYVVIANHQSNLDILLMLVEMEGIRPRFVATHQLAKGIPVISYGLRQEEFTVVDQRRPREALRSIREFGARAGRLDISPAIYPESTRSRDGVMMPFRTLGPATLLKAAPDLPVLPVALDGAWWLMGLAMLPIRSHTTVRLWVGDPIERSPDEDRSALVALTEELITAKVEEWRS